MVHCHCKNSQGNIFFWIPYNGECYQHIATITRIRTGMLFCIKKAFLLLKAILYSLFNNLIIPLTAHAKHFYQLSVLALHV